MDPTLRVAADHVLAIEYQVGSRDIAMQHAMQRFGVYDRRALGLAVFALQGERARQRESIAEVEPC